MSRTLVLASASPRRAELLASAGFVFTVDPGHVDESVQPGETPEGYVLRVARAKALAVAGRRDPAEIILAADTTVVSGVQMLGKPEDEADAVRMLQALAGGVHRVITGVVLLSEGRELTDVVATRVRFVSLDIDDIRWYVQTGEPMGKAGAYAIQGRAARFVDWIEGSWSNVVGLPVATVNTMIKRV